jgi:outer membrane lipoprotein-sorting protein
MNRTWARWLPAAVVPVVIAGGALVSAAQAGAAPDLPAKTANQVLQLVATSTVQTLSGTVQQTAQLGLPELPAGLGAGTGATPYLDLLTGSHQARVYLDGPDRARVQALDKLSERDVVRNGSDAWVYSSETNTATHVRLPSSSPGSEDPPDGTESLAGMPTPAQLARRVLTMVDPSTQVTVGPATIVAGRTAYDLVIKPRATGTLIGEVSIAVDSSTGLPLSVQVDARGQSKPAYRLAFTSISLRKPAADRFRFAPPAGAKVTEQVLPKHGGPAEHAARPGTGDAGPAQGPTISGSGWDGVVQLPVAAVSASGTSSPMVGQVTRAVAGGRLLHTALVNVLLTDDGRILAGSVPLERLQAVAATK